MLNSKTDAYHLLKQLGADAHLIQHLQLVGEAATLLIQACQQLGIEFDAQLVELGAAVHDAGKILYPAEMYAPGSLHEAAGEQLLLQHGVAPHIAHCCVSHASWQEVQTSFEERLLALADKLWKGRRESALELLVIQQAATRLECSEWDIFNQLDSVFEDIAANGDLRLQQSMLTSTP